MNIDSIADFLAGVMMVCGALLAVTAGIGLLRFPDLLSRMHSATKTQVLGLLCMLIATALSMRSWSTATLLLLIALFQLMTAPVSAHMISRAAYRTGQVRTDLLVADESDIGLTNEE